MTFLRLLLTAVLALGVSVGFCAESRSEEADAPPPAQDAVQYRDEATSAEGKDVKAPKGDDRQLAKGAARTLAGAIEASGHAAPEVYWLPDASGRLRRVLGFRYEDFLKLWKEQRSAGIAQQPPGAVIERMTFNGRSHGDVVEADIELEVRLQSSRWTAVPLQLGNMAIVLGEKAKVEGEAEPTEFIAFDRILRNYVLWLRDRAGTRRTIRLTGSIATTIDGERRRFETELPEAVASEATFSAGGRAIEVEAPADVETTPGVADAGSVRLRGVRGAVVLSWPATEGAEAPAATTWDVEVETALRVDPHQLVYDSVIHLDSSGAPVSRCWVRLPPGATLTAGESSVDYDAKPLAELHSLDSPLPVPDRRQIVEVAFRKASRRPPPVHLTCQADRAALVGDAESTQIAGALEVLRAYRQHGYVALQLNDQLHANWELSGDVEQIEPADLPESLLTATPLAAFETSDASWRISLHVQRRVRRLRMTPRYDLRLGAEAAALDAVFAYQITGGRVFELRVDLKGWSLADQPLDADAAIERDEVHVTREGVLVLPLSDPDVQQFRLRLSARRARTANSRDFPLPEALGAATMTGSVSVSGEESLQVVVDSQRSTGISLAEGPEEAKPAATWAPPLAADAAPTSEKESQTETTPASIWRTFLPSCVVAAETSPREREVRATNRVVASLEAGRATLEQQLRFDVRYQPLAELALLVSPRLLENDDFSLSLNDEPLSTSAVEVEPLRGDSIIVDDSSMRLTVRLPAARTGKLALTVRSSWPVVLGPTAAPLALDLPLAVPEVAAVSRAEVQYLASELSAALTTGGDSSWRLVEPAAAVPHGVGATSAFAATDDRSEAVLPLLVQRPEIGRRREIEVQGIWAQSWLQGRMRQDRYVYRVRAGAPEIRFFLPSRLRAVAWEVSVGGRVAAGKVSVSGDELIVSTGVDTSAEQDSAEPVTIELRRLVTANLAGKDQLPLDVPMIVGKRTAGPFVWQVVLPSAWASLGAPAELSEESALGWMGGRWGSKPLRDQRDLERWTGAAAAPPPPSESSQYVFTGYRVPTEAELPVVRRIWMTIAGAACALASGLAVLFTRIGRQRLSWFAASLICGTLVVAFPPWALTALQAVVAGASLAAMAAVIQRWMPEETSTSTSASQVRLRAEETSATHSWRQGEALPNGSDSYRPAELSSQGPAP